MTNIIQPFHVIASAPVSPSTLLSRISGMETPRLWPSLRKLMDYNLAGLHLYRCAPQGVSQGDVKSLRLARLAKQLLSPLGVELPPHVRRQPGIFVLSKVPQHCRPSEATQEGINDGLGEADHPWTWLLWRFVTPF